MSYTIVISEVQRHLIHQLLIANPYIVKYFQNSFSPTMFEHHDIKQLAACLDSIKDSNSEGQEHVCCNLPNRV